MTHTDRQVTAALVTLIMLQAIMLSALYAGVRPHPPVATPLFGIAPFLGAAMSVAVSAVIAQPVATATGRCLALLAAVMALVSFGPHKYFDPQFALIWPAVVLGQFAAIVIFVRVYGRMRAGRSAVPAPSGGAGTL